MKLLANMVNPPLNSYTLDVACSDYVNGLEFIQTFTSVNMTYNVLPLLESPLYLLIICFQVKIRVYL